MIFAEATEEGLTSSVWARERPAQRLRRAERGSCRATQRPGGLMQLAEEVDLLVLGLHRA